MWLHFYHSPKEVQRTFPTELTVRCTETLQREILAVEDHMVLHQTLDISYCCLAAVTLQKRAHVQPALTNMYNTTH